ncbi:MAG TPA: hypothetical protein VHV55_11620 [Pirellulales bacterium]|jgi:hypothetical protein|nr:hypothetical protein [Pirellulales bacterium]
MNENPRRCWFTFRLRTLFMLIAVAAPVLAWVGYALNWIRQRHEVLQAQGLRAGAAPPAIDAPGGLWIFGELGVVRLHDPITSEFGFADPRRLFPETTFVGPNVPLPPEGSRIRIVEGEERYEAARNARKQKE